MSALAHAGGAGAHLGLGRAAPAFEQLAIGRAKRVAVADGLSDGAFNIGEAHAQKAHRIQRGAQLQLL